MKVHIMLGMNKLPVATRAQILSMLCEGASMRSVSRLTDTSINTVSKLLEDAGRFCAGFHDAKVRGVKARRVQVDELWSFCAAKDKNVAAMKSTVDGAGASGRGRQSKPKPSCSFLTFAAAAMANARSGLLTIWRRGS